jgi:hypothetical protein
MLELQSLRYHPATAPEPVLADINLKLRVGTRPWWRAAAAAARPPCWR